MDLKQGSAAALPDADGTFDGGYAINSMHIWPEPQAGLGELRRVLKPGGRVVITEQPKCAKAREAKACANASGEIIAGLSEAGFRGLRLETKHLKPVAALSSVGAN